MTLPTAPPAAAAHPRRTRVLLVEDAADLRDTALEMMDLLGYDASGAGSAEEALAALAGGQPPDILLTDISLPGKSGLELAVICRAQYPALKVIFASGYGEPGDKPVARCWSLPKPYDANALQEMLDRVMAA